MESNLKLLKKYLVKNKKYLYLQVKYLMTHKYDLKGQAKKGETETYFTQILAYQIQTNKFSLRLQVIYTECFNSG